MWGRAVGRMRVVGFAEGVRRANLGMPSPPKSDDPHSTLRASLSQRERDIKTRMNYVIRPLRIDDLDALGRFLTSGLGAAPGADFAAPAVLRWKFLDPTAADSQPRSWGAVDGSGAIVGHVGIVLTAFESAAIPGDGRVGALHMIDWLGSPAHRGVGASLMRRAHEAAPVQFGLGGSSAGRSVIKGGGYRPMPPAFLHRRLLRPLRWFRRSGGTSPGQLARLARELVRKRSRRPVVTLELQRVESFGSEIDSVSTQAREAMVLTTRSADRLNAFLRFPRQAPSGFLIRDERGDVRGFALLNLIANPDGGPVVGKIVDCLLDGYDFEYWHAAFVLLSDELARQGADVADAAPAFAEHGLEGVEPVGIGEMRRHADHGDRLVGRGAWRR